MTDPWTVQSKSQQFNSTTSQPTLEFEDNFITASRPLPDSDNYLRGLERKLQKIKKGSKLVDALAEKREDSLRSLLQSGLNSECVQNNNDVELELDEPINNGELYRHLQPVQPISVGELVHIVNHDQLEQQQIEEENTDEQRLNNEFAIW